MVWEDGEVLILTSYPILHETVAVTDTFSKVWCFHLWLSLCQPM